MAGIVYPSYDKLFIADKLSLIHVNTEQYTCLTDNVSLTITSPLSTIGRVKYGSSSYVNYSGADIVTINAPMDIVDDTSTQVFEMQYHRPKAYAMWDEWLFEEVLSPCVDLKIACPSGRKEFIGNNWFSAYPGNSLDYSDKPEIWHASMWESTNARYRFKSVITGRDLTDGGRYLLLDGNYGCAGVLQETL